MTPETPPPVRTPLLYLTFVSIDKYEIPVIVGTSRCLVFADNIFVPKKQKKIFCGELLHIPVYAEMGIYRDNLSAIVMAITFYRLLLSLKIILIYRLPLSLLLYFLLLPINYRDKRFFMHAVFKLQG